MRAVGSEGVKDVVICSGVACPFILSIYEVASWSWTSCSRLADLHFPSLGGELMFTCSHFSQNPTSKKKAQIVGIHMCARIVTKSYTI